MNTFNPNGPHISTELPELEDYGAAEIQNLKLASPAFARYWAARGNPTADLASELRQFRNHAWLRVSLATHFSPQLTKAATQYWSDVADQVLQRAWNSLNLGTACVIAMGKLGSRELNLSSDVDLILLRTDQSDIHVSEVHKFTELVQGFSSFGFCFRVDYALRPGGHRAPLLPTLGEFESHYGNHGALWERLAFVRARYICGNKELAEEALAFANKFSYRVHLDYSLREGLKNLRRRIFDEQVHKAGHINLKLAPGGIRDIELFAHALLVMYGGRNRALRTRYTDEAFDLLAQADILSSDEGQFLKNFYWQLRTLENKAQSIEDTQTHFISSTEVQAETVRDMERVNQLVTSLLGASEVASPTLSRQSLSELGYSQSTIDDCLDSLSADPIAKDRGADDRGQKQKFVQTFLAAAAKLDIDKDLALANLAEFLGATKAKTSFYSLLNHEQGLANQLVWLFSASPYLSRLLISRPELLDSFFLGQVQDEAFEFDDWLDSMVERRALVELIAGADFLKNRQLLRVGDNLSATADQICTGLLQRLQEGEKSPLKILALGKWGGRELGFNSDLDFVFFHTGDDSADHSKTAKRFVSRITELHRGGSIYAIDMRIRPSGHSGPLMVKWNELQKYILEKADPWERQAYLKARILGDKNCALGEWCVSPGLSRSQAQELIKIRVKLQEKATGELDLKYNAGGLVDIELCVQQSLLGFGRAPLETSLASMIQCLMGASVIWQSSGPRLLAIYEELRCMEQLLRLIEFGSGSSVNSRSPSFGRLAKIFDPAQANMAQTIKNLFSESREILSQPGVLG